MPLYLSSPGEAPLFDLPRILRALANITQDEMIGGLAFARHTANVAIAHGRMMMKMFQQKVAIAADRHIDRSRIDIGGGQCIA